MGTSDVALEVKGGRCCWAAEHQLLSSAADHYVGHDVVVIHDIPSIFIWGENRRSSLVGRDVGEAVVNYILCVSLFREALQSSLKKATNMTSPFHGIEDTDIIHLSTYFP